MNDTNSVVDLSSVRFNKNENELEIDLPVTIGDSDSYICLKFYTDINCSKFIDSLEKNINDMDAVFHAMLANENIDVKTNTVFQAIAMQGVKFELSNVDLAVKIAYDEHDDREGLYDRFDDTQDILDTSISLNAYGFVTLAVDVYDPYVGEMFMRSQIKAKDLVECIREFGNQDMQSDSKMSM